MANELVCKWLGLDAACWPPDHYTLLGLTPAEADPRRVEEHVHERLMRLRAYQLNHPEQVTEAMNRLARACICLTDPAARRAYDASLQSAGHAPAATQPAAPGAPALDTGDPLSWLFGPWSRLGAAVLEPQASRESRADWRSTPPPRRGRPTPPPADTNGDAAPSAPPPAAPPPTGGPGEPEPTEIPRLWTRRAVYEHLVATRRLLRRWERAGRTLSDPTWMPARGRETVQLVRDLRAIHILLEDYPPVVGVPGRPGYWVTALARQEMAVPLLRALGADQRETLARDWRDGRDVLRVRGRDLRRSARRLRAEGWWRGAARELRAWMRRHPALWLAPAAVLAIGLAWMLFWLLPALLAAWPDGGRGH